MEIKIDVIDFAKKVNEKYLDALKIPAKRLGLSAKAAEKLVLLLSENIETSDIYFKELAAAGYVENINGNFSLTSKGGIVAKSLERIKSDFNNAFALTLNEGEKQVFSSIIGKL